MGQFLDGLQPEVRLNDDGETWTVLQRFRYLTNAKELIDVEAGFPTDMASIPRLFWNILPPFGKYGGAAVVHDYLYANQPYPKLHCDNILLQAMKTEGVSWLVRSTIYSAVVSLGWFAWQSDKKKKEAKSNA